VFTGRPLRVLKNNYIMDWHNKRNEEMKKLLAEGTLPYQKDVDERTKEYVFFSSLLAL
jgi:hypothetical protein